jgi:hypothetical protein
MNAVPRSVPFIHLVWKKIPLFFLATSVSLLTILAHQGSGVISSLDKLPLKIRIGNAFISYVKYISKMIWPDRLSVLYPHPIILPFWEVAEAALLLIIINHSINSRRKETQLLYYGIVLVSWDSFACNWFGPGRNTGDGRPIYVYTHYWFVYYGRLRNLGFSNRSAI